MAKRKVSKESVYNKKVERLSAELYNEGKPWTNEMNDDLIEGYLSGLRYRSKGKCLMTVCGRSEKGVENQLWKLFVRYPREGVFNYQPELRRVRTRLPFTVRDLAVVERATSPEGRKTLAWVSSYVGKILGRAPEVVDGLYERIKNQSLKSSKSTLFSREITLIECVYESVKGSYKKLMTEMGL